MLVRLQQQTVDVKALTREGRGQTGREEAVGASGTPRPSPFWWRERSWSPEGSRAPVTLGGRTAVITEARCYPGVQDWPGEAAGSHAHAPSSCLWLNPA